ncbi:MAG: methyltransferase [Holophaga sp.]|nr:methyltransferase [Holophaga sp.]
MIPAFDADPAFGSATLSRLAAIGYDEAGVCRRLGLEDLNDFQMKALPIYRAERLRPRDALAAAIDLLLLEGDLPAAELDWLFAPRDQEALERAGLLVRHGSVRAAASLYPVGRSLVFSDHAWPQLVNGGRAAVPHDQVMYVGTDSRWLARATVRRPVPSALDLCCGSGVHALLAAAHAERATAVDINPRAVHCTACNARLAGRDNLEALQGDLYGPVGDRRFDLITANPPFVPAPAQEVGYRDGGPGGDAVLRRIVAGLPGHLAPGGTAQIVTELGERDGEPLETRLRDWLGGAPMAIHLLRLGAHSAQAYALGHAGGEDQEAILDSVGRWAANLKRQGYQRVVSVLLAFRWSEPAWYREDQAQPPRRDAGAEVEAVFQAERLAREPGLDLRLKAGRVARTGPVALLEVSALGSTAPSTAQARLAGQAMPVEHPLEPLERDLLGCLEQPLATADLLAAAAKAGLDEPAVLAALVSLVRKGLIRPE